MVGDLPEAESYAFANADGLTIGLPLINDNSARGPVQDRKTLHGACVYLPFGPR